MPATLTYRPLTPQNPAEFLRPYPSIYAGYAATHPVQPLKGLPGTRATDVSYRALAPGGAGIGHRICTGASVSRLTAHYSLLTANSLTFTFSAKEKDPKTGLSYFGSRYYSSDLSIWLSVDPMAAKYASTSPYAYCRNNPIKVIDPNGEDEWEVNKSGHIRHVDGSEGTPDKLFVVRGFGKKRFKERIDVEGLNVDADLMKGLCDSEGDGKIVFSKTHSDDKLEKMEEMFNFLADNTVVSANLQAIHMGQTKKGITGTKGSVQSRKIHQMLFLF